MATSVEKIAVLRSLAGIIEDRRGADPSASYTAKLLSKGAESCAKKFGEEAVELALAAVQEDKDHLRNEAADVLYHLLVLLAAKNMPLDSVLAELERRFSMGGLEEKASRPVE